ncbi:BrnA antitoxin family protein [Methylobacterium sp. C33D]|uniref:BrnA antitoxin family protein n=1 Tax=Methylobacterium mesophilicum TaxID=39956 RepID=UPI002F352821
MDAHTITPEEYDEVPELTDAMLARADFYVGDRFLPRGPTGRSDEVVAIHLLPEIVSYFRAQGPGWQARINTVLMEAIERERATQSR